MSGSAAASNQAFEQLSIAVSWWGGMILVVIGGLKLIVYSIGELKPAIFEKIESETVKRFFTGRSNRLVFGLGGFITIAAGGFFMIAAKGMEMLLERIRL